VVEAELLSAASDVGATGFTDFVLRLNHRLALTAMLSAFGALCSAQRRAVALDKLDKIGANGVSEELAARCRRLPSTRPCVLAEMTGPYA
jgi:histidyl-tRNA synthetase